MLRYFGLALLVFALPPAARVARAAEDVAPEELLPAGTHIYARWDGIDAHKKAYGETALGKMLKGDTGKFVQSVYKQLQETLSSGLTVQALLGGAAPDNLEKLTADAKEAPKLLPLLGQEGFVLGVEVRGLEPPDAQLILILPNTGPKSKPFFATLRLVAGLAKVEIKEEKIAGRAVSSVEAGPVQIAAWVEGKHTVLSVGTAAPADVVKRMSDKSERLTSNPLYKRVKGFDKFETGARAFVDVAGLVTVAKKRGQDVAKLIDQLGLDGLKSVVFYSGFDGAAEQSLAEFDAPGPRKGLLRLVGGKPFKLADVPPLPPDAISWSMTNFDLAALYDTGTEAAETIAKLIDPESVSKVKEAIEQADTFTGINIRKDFLANLGGQIVVYNTSADGPFTLGQTILLKVKDADKVREALDTAIKGIGQSTGADLSIKKRKYRGVDVREVHIRQQGVFFTPTYAIHKDWLVLGFYPQAVHGYILRATGELKAWKPSANVQKSLDKLPKDVVSVSVSDPRPTIKTILSIAPLAASLLNSFEKEVGFKIDVGALPNAHEATKHLFPNVSVVSDDGKVIRQETRASLALPFDVGGVEIYAVAALFLARVNK
jgi:hypothetical protein